jgi:hypothetical protein
MFDAIKAWLEPFIYGILVGYLWFPVWQLLKKIYHEAKYARDNWSKPQ